MGSASSSVPRQPAHLHTHTQAESGAYSRDPSRIPRRRPVIYLNRHTPSGQSRVYWASKPQDSSKRVLPRQVTMDQSIGASLSHTHYWYEVGMLKVPVVCTLTLIESTMQGQQTKSTRVIIIYCFKGCKDTASTWYLNGVPDGSNIGSTV